LKFKLKLQQGYVLLGGGGSNLQLKYFITKLTALYRVADKKVITR